MNMCYDVCKNIATKLLQMDNDRYLDIFKAKPLIVAIIDDSKNAGIIENDVYVTQFLIKLRSREYFKPSGADPKIVCYMMYGLWSAVLQLIDNAEDINLRHIINFCWDVLDKSIPNLFDELYKEIGDDNGRAQQPGYSKSSTGPFKNNGEP